MRFSFKNTALLVTLLMVLGCGTVRPVPVQTTANVTTTVRDSIVVHRDTVTLEVPVESTSAVNVQHSHLETTVAVSEASVDSLGLLNHTLRNKPFKTEKEIVYLDRKVVEYRDSVQVKEVPVEVEVPVRYVPSFYKWCLVWSIVSLLLLACSIYFKLR